MAQTPTEAESPVEDEDVFMIEIVQNPPEEPTPAVRNLFGPNDSSWTQDPAKDMPNLPIPKGYNPEAERRRRQTIGYRYHPPGAPFKGTTLKEVEWSDFLFDAWNSEPNKLC